MVAPRIFFFFLIEPGRLRHGVRAKPFVGNLAQPGARRIPVRHKRDLIARRFDDRLVTQNRKLHHLRRVHRELRIQTVEGRFDAAGDRDPVL